MSEFLQKPHAVISVVIPAFNEEPNVPIVVERTIQVLEQQYGDTQYEIVLVNDGSSDKTGQVCDMLAQQHQPVRVFHHHTNQGIGAALTTGFTQTQGEYVSFIPGDGEIGIEQVVNLHRAMEQADLIVSTRRDDDAPERGIKVRSWYREVLTLGLRYILIIILGFNPEGKEGIFVIRNDVLRHLRMTSTTGLLSIEILMQCYRSGVTVKEGTITIQPRLSGQSKVTNLPNYLKYLWEILKLRVRSR